MNEQELARFIEWLENMVTGSRISMSENRDDTAMEAYFQGRVSAYQDCLTTLQMDNSNVPTN